MRPVKMFPIVLSLAGAVILGSSSPARATMQLKLASGNDSVLISTETSPGKIYYSNDSFTNTFALDMVSAKSNSAFDGPNVYSELDIKSFSVTNLTGSQQTLTLTLSDVGFDPNSGERPLTVYNSASGTFSQLSTGTLSFQTFAYDGSAYFQTGPGAVATAPVILTPAASGYTTTAPFSPQGSQFSLTNVMTITLDPYAELSGFSGVSLVHAPEPGALTIILSGLTALAFGDRLRRRGRRD
jgi:hypothetical protein